MCTTPIRTIEKPIMVIEGSLEVIFRTYGQLEKQRWEESERRREEERRSERERVRRKKRQVLRKGRKFAIPCVFPMICGSGGSKNWLVVRWEMKGCTSLWREAHVQVKKLKAPHVRTAFGSWDVEKVTPFVARSTFPSQKAKSHLTFGPLLKLRCRKSGRRCGAKHISKSKS